VSELVAAFLACYLLAGDLLYDPTGMYDRQEIEGWTIYVNPRLPQADGALCARTLEVLAAKLLDIARVVPEPALAKLRAIPVWVEHADPRHPCMCYHVSRDWLVENGFNPEKEGAVEIANAGNFLRWTLDQPWMVLHELAHGYHHQVITYGNEALEQAFEHATEGGRYESVLRFSGQVERHYALNNATEYFAEGTEAFFGTNDFYPFVNAELRQHDPELYDLLGDLWGTDP